MTPRPQGPTAPMEWACDAMAMGTGDVGAQGTATSVTNVHAVTHVYMCLYLYMYSKICVNVNIYVYNMLYIYKFIHNTHIMS